MLTFSADVAFERERNTYDEPSVLFGNDTFMLHTFCSAHPSMTVEPADSGVRLEYLTHLFASVTFGNK